MECSGVDWFIDVRNFFQNISDVIVIRDISKYLRIISESFVKLVIFLEDDSAIMKGFW